MCVALGTGGALSEVIEVVRDLEEEFVVQARQKVVEADAPVVSLFHLKAARWDEERERERERGSAKARVKG